MARTYREPQFFRVMQYAAEADHDVVDMVSGNPDWEPPAPLREGLHEYADGDPETFQYPPSEGLADLRAEIGERRGVDPDRLVVTNGTGEANHLAMACGYAAYPGAEILLADPVYPYYAGRTDLLGATARYVAADPDGQLSSDAVAAEISDETAVVVLNSPNNPTGAVYSEGTVRAIADLAAEHDALLVSDEVYDHFDYAGRFESALALDHEHVVVTNGFSKSMAITGLRVGYAVFPAADAPDPAGGVGDAARTRHMLTNVTGSRPAQYAVLRVLRETPPEYYEHNRERLAARIDAFTDALDAAGAQYTEPQGAFYVMARFEGFEGSFENVERLVDEAGVAGMPGRAFGDAYSDWFRFALVTDRVGEAADRLAGFFE